MSSHPGVQQTGPQPRADDPHRGQAPQNDGGAPPGHLWELVQDEACGRLWWCHCGKTFEQRF